MLVKKIDGRVETVDQGARKTDGVDSAQEPDRCENLDVSHLL